jgi:hypothetical protein
MLTRFWNRPSPELDRQPLALEHLQDMGRTVSKRVLSQDAYAALLLVGATRRVIVDAYTHGGPKGEWVIEVHGAYPWQECRWTPAQWEAFYTRHLASLYWNGNLTGDAWVRLCAGIAREYPNGQLASTVDAGGGAA